MKTQNIQLEPAGPRITSTNAGLLIRLNTYRAAVLALFFAGITLLGTSAASAATITVINTNDSGPGSLRQALSDANNGDTINFNSSLNGLGANNLTVDGNANDRVFYINFNNTVTISGLTITNGHAQLGGGIYNQGGFKGATLTVSNCAISANEGAGIINTAAGTLTVNNSTLSGNEGVGIFNDGHLASVTLTVNNSTLSGNGGAGIVNAGTGGFGATLTVNNSTLSGNQSGGIYNTGYGTDFNGGSATLTVTNSTLSSNSTFHGGGIYNQGGPFGGASVTITNSTVSGNSANAGGGIYNVGSFDGSATVTITNSTLSGNSASQGGGIYNYGGSIYTTSLMIGDTILNAGASGENIYNASGTVSSLGYNLSSDNGSGYLTGPGDQINTDPMLGALQGNGGPTFTHALLPSSPAIDAGAPSFTPPPFYDQRGPGFNRVVNGRIDIGSFEVQGPTPTPTPTPTPALW